MFTADGELIEAQPVALALLGERRDLLGARRGSARARGKCSTELPKAKSPAGQISVLKLGAGSTFTLLVVFAEPAATPGTDSEAGTMAPKVSDSAPLTTRQRRLPLRFVWQTDADGRFSLASREFSELIGPKTSAVLDRSWAEISQELMLDPQGQIAAAMAARQTFSGIVLLWPLDNSADQMVVEMSGSARVRSGATIQGLSWIRNLPRPEEGR